MRSRSKRRSSSLSARNSAFSSDFFLFATVLQESPDRLDVFGNPIELGVDVHQRSHDKSQVVRRLPLFHPAMVPGRRRGRKMAETANSRRLSVARHAAPAAEQSRQLAHVVEDDVGGSEPLG